VKSVRKKKGIKGGNAFYERTSYMWPFHGRGATANQKKWSILAMMLGLYLMLVAIPFQIQIGESAFLSSYVGVAVFLIGLGYFIDVI